jgi:hypothetical protein
MSKFAPVVQNGFYASKGFQEEQIGGVQKVAERVIKQESLEVVSS